MKKKLALCAVSIAGVLALLVPATSSAKVPAACVERTVGRVHVQIGYCP